MYVPSIALGAVRANTRTAAPWLCVLLISAAAGLLGAGCQRARPANGTIKGTIGVEGEVPKLEPLKITKDEDVCKNVPNESLIVSPTGGVQNVVVALEGVPESIVTAQKAEQPVFKLTNSGCRFVPHVLVMQSNEPLEISNLDPILHTARALQSQVNVGLYPGRAVRSEIGKPVLGPAKITCEIHPWMLAYVYLTDNPYYALTDVHGEFEIDNVPPGKYQVRIWHELLGTQVQDVEVFSGKATDLNYNFPPKQTLSH